MPPDRKHPPADAKPGDQRVRVVIVQDHPLLASAIARVIEGQPDLSVRGIARSAADAAVLAARENADVALVDFQVGEVSGPFVAELIQIAHPATAIVFHSAEESEKDLLDAIDAGAAAYLPKSAPAEQLVEAVRRAAKGEVLIPAELFARAIDRQRRASSHEAERQRLLRQFTPRELEILHLLAQSLEVDTMATQLGIAPHTVEWHIRHLFEKLKVHSKLQVVIEAARKGLIDI